MREKRQYIQIKNLSKNFENNSSEFKVLDDISLEIGSGDFIAICGRSGVGKSTLIRMIAGLVNPTSGTIKIDGRLVVEPPNFMGFVTQDYSRSLLPWFTVEKNIALPFKTTEIPKISRRQKVEDVLNAVGLADFAKFYPWQLSGGMQQRVAIARALVLEPKLLLLDEPFASVDAQIRLELEDLIADIVFQKKITTIIVTHDIDEAIYLADKVILLANTPASISKVFEVKLKRPRTQVETRSDPKFIKLRTQLYASLRGK